MTYTLDHLFIWTGPGAPAVDRLVALGLTEGSGNVHSGQGTANRRFFFRNAMLEFLWVEKPDETASEGIRRTHLLERWSGRDGEASPFGVCLRPAGDPSEEVPFSHWDWHPPYLPDTMPIQVANNASIINEPFVFNLSWTSAPEVRNTEPMTHTLGVERITGITLHGPHPERRSGSLAQLAQTGVVALESAETHCMTLTFDTGKRGQQADLRPDLPLIIVW
jgi:hypothetical protein